MSRELRQFLGAPLHQPLELGAALGEILGFALLGAYVTDGQAAQQQYQEHAGCERGTGNREIYPAVDSPRTARGQDVAGFPRRELAYPLHELRHGPLADIGTNQVEGGTGPVLAVENQRLAHLNQLCVAEPLDLLDLRA